MAKKNTFIIDDDVIRIDTYCHEILDLYEIIAKKANSKFEIARELGNIKEELVYSIKKEVEYAKNPEASTALKSRIKLNNDLRREYYTRIKLFNCFNTLDENIATCKYNLRAAKALLEKSKVLSALPNVKSQYSEFIDNYSNLVKHQVDKTKYATKIAPKEVTQGF